MGYPMSGAVIEQIVTKLSNSSWGLNATYNALAATYSLPAESATLAINFAPTNGKSLNFALANVNPKDWEGTGAYQFPLVTLFTDGGANENHEKFHQFSGPVHVGMNVFLTWRENRLALSVFEPVAWCMEEAVVTVFNRARNAFPIDQDWGQVAVYNGDINWAKSRVERGGAFWLQGIAFKLLFEVNQRGDT